MYSHFESYLGFGLTQADEINSGWNHNTCCMSDNQCHALATLGARASADMVLMSPVRHQAITWTIPDLLWILEVQWNFNRHITVFIAENTNSKYEKVVCKITAILYRNQCVYFSWHLKMFISRKRTSLSIFFSPKFLRISSQLAAY